MKTLYELSKDDNATLDDYKELIAKLPIAVRHFDIDTDLIGTIWTIDDVKSQSERELTDKQAKEILDLCEPSLIEPSEVDYNAIDDAVAEYFGDNEEDE